MFTLLMLTILAVIIVSIVGHAVSDYRASTGTRWERLLATSRDSATWLWAKVMLVSGLLLQGASYAAEFFHMPDVDAFIRTKVSAAQLGWVLIAIATITFLARFRGIFRDTP